jgi:hypothetical protein
MTQLLAFVGVIVASVVLAALAMWATGGLNAVRRRAGLLVLMAAVLSAIGLMILFVRDPSTAFALWLDLLGLLFVAFFVALGVYMAAFSRHFAIRTLEYRLAIWKIGYAESDVRFGQVLGVVVGSAFALFGVIRIVSLLLAG